MLGIFNDCYPPILDGVALTAQNYAYWLNQKGHDVCVVTTDAPHVVDTEDFPIYRYRSLPIPMRNPYRYGIPMADLSFRHQFRDLNFELVHAHCPFATGHLALNVAHKQHIPLVATFHSKYRQDFERVVPVKAVVDQVIRNIIRFYEKADEVWIPQEAVEPTLREYGYKGHVEVVENGNDFVTPPAIVNAIRTDMRNKLGVGDHEFMLLFVGQHIWEKNIGLILDSLSLIRHLPYKFFMVGTGYAVAEIREKAAKLGISDKVQLMGVVHDWEELKRYYAAADLFLFPSLYDNAPLIVREAAAMHTPAVMLQESTAAEIINDYSNGFLTSNSARLYADMVAHLIEHPHLIEKVGNEAAHTITRSWEDIVDEVFLRYQDICKSYKQKLH